MDNQANPQTQDQQAEKSGGCCGGKADAQSQAGAEQPKVEIADDKPAASGCCCGQN